MRGKRTSLSGAATTLTAPAQLVAKLSACECPPAAEASPIFLTMTDRRVKLVECPRDAWQGLPRGVPTEIKVQYLRALVAAGFRHIDAVSFVSTKAVPQMADSEAVLEQLAPPADVEIIGIVVNAKGVERAIATGAVSTLGYPCSTSETFLRRNQNQTAEENHDVLKLVKQRADAAGLGTVAYISMAFGNPYEDRWSEEIVLEEAVKIARLGVDTISLADTVGLACPGLISGTVRRVVRECAECQIGVHMHSTRAGAEAKVLAAFDAGCRRFDSALGGLGGCPFAQDKLVGNIPTEEVFRALEQRGVKLENALEAVLAINAVVAREFSS
jgi:hydroxymethylglutaryl-CoA lyase